MLVIGWLSVLNSTEMVGQLVIAWKLNQRRPSATDSSSHYIISTLGKIIRLLLLDIVLQTH